MKETGNCKPQKSKIIEINNILFCFQYRKIKRSKLGNESTTNDGKFSQTTMKVGTIIHKISMF